MASVPLPPAPPRPYLSRLTGAIARRFDSWYNAVTGVGGASARSSMRFGVFEGEYLGLADLESLYNFDGVCARVVDSIPEHALRQGVTVSTGDSAQETELLSVFDALKVVETFRRAWTWGRLFGGGAVLLGADDGRDPAEPLDEGGLRAIRWLTDVDRRDLYPLTWEADHESARFGLPVLYTLNRMGGTRSQTMTVHHSRLIRFEGPPPTRRRRLTLNGWGDSVLQRCYQEIMQMRGAFAAAGELTQQASQGVIKMRGLMDMLSSDTDDLVKRRLALMDQARSVARSVLLDADGEDFNRVDAGSLGGVADIMDRQVNMVASVSGIPVSILMEGSPGGLGGGEDPNTRTWYDRLRAEQESGLRPRFTRFLRLVMLSREGPTGGQLVKGARVVFPPLWQPSAAEETDLRAKQATTDAAYITAGVLTPEEVALSRFRREGYSTDTSIDLDAREAALKEGGATGEGEDGSTDPVDAPDHDAVAAIIAKVAAREIPRDAGVQLLRAHVGDNADAVMGEAGKTFFTAPEPGHAAELSRAREELAQAKRSAQSAKAMLGRVLERNRAGELVVKPIGAAGEKAAEEIEPGDVVQVEEEPAEGSADPAQGEKADGADALAPDPDARHVAVVFPLAPADAARVVVAGGEPAGDLHMTLVYLGKRTLTDDERDRIVRALKVWAAWRRPLQLRIGYPSRFVGADPAKGDAVYRSVSGVDLVAERAWLVQALADAGFPNASKHPAWAAHVTVAYARTGERSPVGLVTPLVVTMDRVALWEGDRRTEVVIGERDGS